MLKTQGTRAVGRLIKLLKTNVADGLIELSEEGITYTAIKTITGNTKSSVHWDLDDDFPGIPVTDDYLQAEDGQYILTEEGKKLADSIRG